MKTDGQDQEIVTAAELRERGIPVPDQIPDVAWVPRWSVRWTDPKCELGDTPHSIRLRMTVDFLVPFRWVELLVELPGRLRNMARKRVVPEVIATSAPKNGFQKSHVAANKNLAKPVSKRERKEREDLVEELILRATSTTQIEAAMRARYGIGPKVTARVASAVRERWLEERKGRTLSLEKEEQVRRLRWLIVKCREDKDGKQLPPEAWDKATIAKLEHELAKILGTYEPERVELDVVANRTVLMLLQQLGPDEVDALVRSFDAREVVEAPADDDDDPDALPH